MLQTERNRIETDKFTLARLKSNDEFRCTEAFDCGLEDLNDFFREDALPHKEQLLAETYYFQPLELTKTGQLFPVAFVSFLNDSIHIERDERKAEKKGFWRHLKKSVPYPKRNYESFPAVKIGRLGVLNEYARLGIGTYLLNMTKDLFLTDNRTGCRFITVDAYNEVKVIAFYQKNGFDFLWDKDKNDKTRIMFFDLLRHQKAFA
ncbi:MAG: GNAT family N-acetyltransferase [Thermodesulfobacteriota bacterium]